MWCKTKYIGSRVFCTHSWKVELLVDWKKLTVWNDFMQLKSRSVAVVFKIQYRLKFRPKFLDYNSSLFPEWRKSKIVKISIYLVYLLWPWPWQLHCPLPAAPLAQEKVATVTEGPQTYPQGYPVSPHRRPLLPPCYRISAPLKGKNFIFICYNVLSFWPCFCRTVYFKDKNGTKKQQKKHSKTLKFKCRRFKSRFFSDV